MEENEFNLKDAQGAVDYLASARYQDVRVLETEENNPPRISYEPGSGDGTWESGLAAWNEWAIKGRGACCSKARENAKYCGTCGAGLKRVVWTRDEETDDIIKFLEAEADKDLKNTRGLGNPDNSERIDEGR